MENKYKSEQLMVCHESAMALYEIGAIDSEKMREFDKACLIYENEANLEVVEDVTVALLSI